MTHDYAPNFSLTQHVNVKHKGLKYTCSFTSCDKTFNTKQSFYTHEKMHKYNYLFLCQKCSKGFMKEDHFKVHVNRHNQIRPFQCDNWCKKIYRKNEVKRHLINTCQHSSESEIACPICCKTFKNVDCLRNHRNCVHKEGNRLKCPYYQKFSFHKSTILRHVKSKHADML